MVRYAIWKRCLVEAGYNVDRMTCVSELSTDEYKGTGLISLCYSDKLKAQCGVYARNDLQSFFSSHKHREEPIRVTFGKQEFIFAGQFTKMGKDFSSLTKVVAAKMKNGRVLDPEEFPLAIVEGDLINVMWEQLNNPTEELEIALANHVIKNLKPILKKIVAVEKQDNYSKAIKQLLLGAESQIDQAIRNKQQAERKYFAGLRSVGSEISRLEGEKVVFQKRNSQLTTYLDQLKNYLKKNKLVSKFELSGSVLSFNVKGIVISDDDIAYSLPEYRVSINLLNSQLVINLASGSSEADYFYHPHVKKSGEVCLGNFSEIYRKVLLSGDLRQCIEIILEFLRSYNPSSSYCSLTYIEENYPQK